MTGDHSETIARLAQRLAYDDALSGREPCEQARLDLVALAESMGVPDALAIVRGGVREGLEAGAARRLFDHPEKHGARDDHRSGDLRLETKTDVDNSQRFVAEHGGDLRYCYARRSWLVWSGHRWRWDDGAEVSLRAEQTVRGMRLEAKQALAHAADERDHDARKRAIDRAKRAIAHAEHSESIARRRAMVDGAQHHLAVDAHLLDADDWLLGCENGVVDLRTGELRPGMRDDNITKSTGINFDPGAECRRWDSFLDEIMANDSELAAFVQRFAGYALTGSTREECLLLALGETGSNGKSVCQRTLESVFGEYARTIGFDLLLSDSRGKNKGPALAELDGVRLILASEPNANRNLDEALIKRLTGRDTISVEAKYEAPRTIEMRGKLLLACNHPPSFPRGGHAIQRRLLILPFGVTVSVERQDKELPATLEAEAAGILAWCVRGCLAWQREGLAPPARAIGAAENYFASADPLHEWLQTETVEIGHVETPLSSLHKSYLAWAEQSGITRPVGVRQLGPMLRERGYSSQRNMYGVMFRGIALSTRNHEAMTMYDDDAETPSRETQNSSQKSSGIDVMHRHSQGNFDLENQPTDPWEDE